MSKKNDILTDFFSRVQIFAELFNGSLYEGRQVIKPEQLAEIQNFYNEPIQKRYGKKKRVEKRLDMCKAFEDLMMDCRMEGRKEGQRTGQKEGEERLGRLITLLLSDGRTKEVKTAASNVVTRRKLYKEYGL